MTPPPVTESDAAYIAACPKDDGGRVIGPPHQVQVGQVYRRVGYLTRDGWRMKPGGEPDIRIVQVPGGRRTTYRYVKIDPPRGGNGRRDRQDHPITMIGLSRNYLLDEA